MKNIPIILQSIWFISLLAMTACTNQYSTQIIFDRVVTTYDNQGTEEYAQIFRMDSNGNNVVNLSNRNWFESKPNVNNNGKKIVYISGYNEIYTMNVDGSDNKAVPNSPRDANYPKWSRGVKDDFILFSYPYYSGHAAIYRINPDGSNLTQLTNPPPEEMDLGVISIDDSYIVFSRYHNIPNRRSDLYVKNLWDNSPETILIKAPLNCELYFPAVSHDGKKLAYRFWDLNNGQDYIQLVEFTSPTSTSSPKNLVLKSPAKWGITGIDFSSNDQEIIVSMEADDVPVSEIGRHQEIFKLSINGTNQTRLTNNLELDEHPSVIP